MPQRAMNMVGLQDYAKTIEVLHQTFDGMAENLEFVEVSWIFDIIKNVMLPEDSQALGVAAWSGYTDDAGWHYEAVMELP